MAGIVEHAISVLHNIGNAITPLVVRLQKLHQNKVESQFSSYLQQLYSLLEQHQGDLGDFFSSPRGQQFLPFLKQLTQTSDQQEEDELKSMDVMAHQLDHITEIIALQQKYATQQSNTEEVRIEQVIDDAIEMMKPAFDKRNIMVIEEVQPELPKIQNDPNKLLGTSRSSSKYPEGPFERSKRTSKGLLSTLKTFHSEQLARTRQDPLGYNSIPIQSQL